LAVAMMSSNAAFSKQLLNMSNRNPQLKSYAQQAQILADRTPLGPKFAALRGLVTAFRDRDPDFRVVVFTMRAETLRALQEALEGLGIRVGSIRGNQPAHNSRAIADFTADTPLVNVLLCT